MLYVRDEFDDGISSPQPKHIGQRASSLFHRQTLLSMKVYVLTDFPHLEVCGGTGQLHLLWLVVLGHSPVVCELYSAMIF